MAHKRAVVKMLFNRAIKICSSLCEKKNVYLLLNVIKRYSKTTSKKQMEKDQVEVTVVLPYVKIFRVYEKNSSQFEYKNEFQTSYQILSRMLVHPKDRIHDRIKDGVVYKIPSGSCDKV